MGSGLGIGLLRFLRDFEEYLDNCCAQLKWFPFVHSLVVFCFRPYDFSQNALTRKTCLNL